MCQIKYEAFLTATTLSVYSQVYRLLLVIHTVCMYDTAISFNSMIFPSVEDTLLVSGYILWP